MRNLLEYNTIFHICQALAKMAETPPFPPDFRCTGGGNVVSSWGKGGAEMTPIHQLLDIPRGLTAVMGSGGKTSLLYTLAEELRPLGTVLLTTTTHILRPEQYPFADTPEALRTALTRYGVVCTGSTTPEGKLAAPAFPGWETAADFVLVEADGSRRLPAKAHETWEPVLPETRRRTVCVLGASCFGRPIRQAAHRPALYAALSGAAEDTLITPELAARVLTAEGGFDIIYVNQIDDPDFSPALTLPFAAAVPCPVVVGSLWNRRWRAVP